MSDAHSKTVSGALGAAPEQVLIAGDWHGNAQFAVQVLKQAHADGITHILHVGDFGIWPSMDGVKFLRALDRQLALYGQTLWFIDGNHEDHDQLDALPIDPQTGVRRLAGRIFHLPRGFRWTWAGRTWMALGGATSLDRKRRIPGKSWWPQEALSERDMFMAMNSAVDLGADGQGADGQSGGFVDIMLTHDCPSGVHIPGLTDGWDQAALYLAQEHRYRLSQVVRAVRPELLIHGHFHIRYEDRLDYDLENQIEGPIRASCEVHGLGSDDGTRTRNTMTIRPADR